MRFIVFYLLNIFLMATSVAQVKISLSENMNLKECKASDYISSIQYIPLETTDNCLLGGELQIIATPQYFFIHDFNEYKVYRFDAVTGKYLNLIGKRGQGPGEYARLQGLYIDDSEKKCFLLSNAGIYVYGYDGRFYQRISIPTYCFPTRMERIGNYYILNNALYPETKKELFLMDLKGKILKEKELTDKSRMGFMIPNPFFFKLNNQCYYKNDLTETIYSLDEKLNLKPAYWIDCGKKAFNPKDNQYDLASGRNLAKEKIVIGSVKGYNNNLYIIYYINNKRHFAIYNMKTGGVFSTGKNGSSGLTDDLTYGPLITPPDNTSLYDSSIPGRLLYWVIPSDIDTSQYQKGEFGKIIKQIDEDSNPIIRIINLK